MPVETGNISLYLSSRSGFIVENELNVKSHWMSFMCLKAREALVTL